MISLRLRLLLGAIIGVLLALAIAAVVLVAAFENHLRNRYVEELDGYLYQLAALVQVEPPDGLALRHDMYNAAFQQPFSGLYWQVHDERRIASRSRSLWDFELAVAAAGPPPGQRRVADLSGPRKQALVGVERVIILEGPPDRSLRLIVAGETTAIAASRQEFIATVGYLLAVLGGLLALASWVQVGMGLAPLTVLRGKLEQLRKGRVELIDGRYPDEIAGLVDDLNRLLEVQSHEVERARANAGKLGHGLKTPLAVLGAECRALRSRGEAASAAAIEHEISEMNAQVARVIASARAVGPRRAIGTVTPLAPMLVRMIDVMKRLPRGADIAWTLEIDPPDLSAPVDQRDLEELLGNLMDNARKWARARVLVDVALRDGSIVVSVSDDGPGIAEERRDDVLGGGFRLDPAVPGTGIGLAIANDLAVLHGGRLTIGAGALGGAQVSVSVASAP